MQRNDGVTTQLAVVAAAAAVVDMRLGSPLQAQWQPHHDSWCNMLAI
jgi:hypothetical protein